MQHAWGPEPGLWFSKVTTDSILTFQQGRTNPLSVFGSGATEPRVLKWIRTFKVLVRFSSIAGNLWKTQLDILRMLHFETCSILTILTHCDMCWCISHEQWEDWRSQELSESEGHGGCCVCLRYNWELVSEVFLHSTSVQKKRCRNLHILMQFSPISRTIGHSLLSFLKMTFSGVPSSSGCHYHAYLFPERTYNISWCDLFW